MGTKEFTHKKNGDKSNLRDAFFSYLILGYQFDLPHMPRKTVVSRYIPCRTFDIVVESPAWRQRYMSMQCRSVAGRGSRSAPLTMSGCRHRRSSRGRTSTVQASASKIGDDFNGDVNEELVMLITCYKTYCQWLERFPLRLSWSI